VARFTQAHPLEGQMTASPAAAVPAQQWAAQQAREHAAALHDVLAERASLKQQLTDTSLRLEAALSMLSAEQRAALPAL
jgi:hypothetical protein